MQDLIASPTANGGVLDTGGENEDANFEDNLIKIRLFFFCDEKSLHKKVFAEEWYHMANMTYGEENVSKDFQPWIEVS